MIVVAFDFVFDSMRGFTRAVSRQFGMPPTQLPHTSGFPIPVFIPHEFSVGTSAIDSRRGAYGFRKRSCRQYSRRWWIGLRVK